MALSDCPKCWDTPCICGHEWERRSIEYLNDMISVLEDVVKRKTLSDGAEIGSMDS